MSDAVTTFTDVRAAAARIAGHIKRTPLLQSSHLSRQLGASVYFKCENLQSTGSFKARGACNAVLQLTPALAAAGVATHSSGNHAAALARAARLRGIGAYVVMPRNASAVKRAAVLSYGAQVIDCEPTLAAREQAAAAVVARTGATLIHPYDDARVIAGQGTAILELEHTALTPATVLTPLGGGGLLSGTALAVRALWPRARLVGAEPAAADDGARSFASGHREHVDHPQTIADGLRGELSERTLSLILAHVDEIVTVSETAIVEAMRLVWHFLKVLIEPSAAVPVAALLERRLSVVAAPVIIVLSGGNMDLDALPWVQPKC